MRDPCGQDFVPWLYESQYPGCSTVLQDVTVGGAGESW